jgi:hypothetical protein
MPAQRIIDDSGVPGPTTRFWYEDPETTQEWKTEVERLRRQVADLHTFISQQNGVILDLRVRLERWEG